MDEYSEVLHITKHYLFNTNIFYVRSSLEHLTVLTTTFSVAKYSAGGTESSTVDTDLTLLILCLRIV